jgi:hypothetical protein
MEGAAVSVFWREEGAAEWIELATEQVTEEVGFRFPPTEALLTDYPDLPGTFTIHRALITPSAPGVRCEWEVRELGAATASGVVVAGAAPDAETRFAWIADTMAPSSSSVAAVLAGESFDLFVHGGDIQYRSGLVDTWNGMFQTFAGVFRRASAMFTIGNHEFEAEGPSGNTEDVEYDGTYRRLFGAQGDVGGTAEYYAFTWGRVRFLILNSEDPLFAVDGPQMSWLRAELEATRNNAEMRYAIVGFHRPYYTFGNSGPNYTKRAYLHTLFVEYGVPLVLTGHNHSYERFVVDGIHYVVDGGGGRHSRQPGRSSGGGRGGDAR